MAAYSRNTESSGHTASSRLAAALRALVFSVVIIAAVVGAVLAHAPLESASPADTHSTSGLHHSTVEP
ncbi:hypothetical protein ACUSIJ_06610 [Pseudochelatococcus sp. B33]